MSRRRDFPSLRSVERARGGKGQRGRRYGTLVQIRSMVSCVESAARGRAASANGGRAGGRALAFGRRKRLGSVQRGRGTRAAVLEEGVSSSVGRDAESCDQESVSKRRDGSILIAWGGKRRRARREQATAGRLLQRPRSRWGWEPRTALAFCGERRVSSPGKERTGPRPRPPVARRLADARWRSRDDERGRRTMGGGEGGGGGGARSALASPSAQE